MPRPVMHINFGNPGSEQASERARHASNCRRPVGQRPRGGDPATSEREYSADEMEFLRAIDEHRRRYGTIKSDDPAVLRVAASLGYFRPASVAGD